MNVYHIVNEKIITSPVTAFCGVELDRQNGDYLWADQAETDLHCRGKHCQDCLDSDDYVLYLLGEVGEDSKGLWAGVDFKAQGTVTGRMSFKGPNYSQSIRHVMRAGENKAMPTTVFVSPAEYRKMELVLAKKVLKV